MKLLAKRSILFICLGIISTNVYSQSIKAKAMIVVENSDTLKGWVSYSAWAKNPLVINFYKDSTSNDFFRYTKYQLNYLEVFGKDKYIQKIVKKDARPVDKLADLQFVNDSTVIDTVLLRVLVHGDALSLYELIDEKAHYFIEENKSDQIAELMYKIVHDGGNSYREDKIYINQLRAFLISKKVSARLLGKIDNAKYNDGDIKKVVVRVNEELSAKMQYVHKQSGGKQFSFFLGAGSGYNWVKFKGEAVNNFTHMNFSGSVVPFVTIGFEATTARRLGDLSVRGELSSTMAIYTGTGFKKATSVAEQDMQLDYRVIQKSFIPTISFLYNYLRNESNRAYFGMAWALAISSYGDNIFIEKNGSQIVRERENFIDYPKTAMIPVFKLGVNMKRKFSVEVDGRFITSLGNTVFWALRPKIFTLQARYYL